MAARRLLAQRGFLTQAGSLLAGIAIWQVLGMTLHFEWLPPFSAAVAKVGDMWSGGELQTALAESIGNLVIGYVVSAVGGVGLGTAMALVPKVNYALRIYVNAFLLAPSIVMAPIFFIFFGLSRLTPISVIVLYSILFITVNTYTAMTQVDRHLEEMARCLGAGRWQIFRHVTLPAAMPLTMAGLRLGMGRAVKGMINGELFIAIVGLGRLDQTFESTFDAAGILAIMLIVVVVAVLATSVVQFADRRVNGWLYRAVA
jgi:NitT/TauT family transport system permease protein